jgi:hypothetical protein
MAETDAAVAIYWDFENVHACLIDDQGGEQTYRATAKYRSQEVVVDVARVVEYAAALGRVAVHRAYANWQFFGKYAGHLQAHAIDLVQLFPLTSAKNGADIRLALDVIDDLRRHPQITHVVVVGSDSDYTALAQRCRTYGIHFVGVGTARTARSYPAACDEFVRYHELPPAPRFVPAVLPAPAPVTGAAVASLAGAAPATPAALIEGLLKRKKQRLPADRQLLWTGTGLIAEIFAAAPDGIVASFDSLRLELETAAAAHGIAVPESEFRKLKAILWRAHAFDPLGYALGLRLREPDAAALRLRAVATLLRQLPDPAEADLSALAEAIFGPGATAEQQDLISAALLQLAGRPQAITDADEAADADGADEGDAAGCRDESAGWESAA